jgi:hypothetical protein
VILADVNVLVYAFDEETTGHEHYRDWLLGAIVGDEGLGLVDAVLAGFVRIVTDPRIYDHPASALDALDFVDSLAHAPSTRWISSNLSAWKAFGALAERDTGIRGNRIPDAFLAALSIVNGARLATADRGFARYPGLNWFDPARPAQPAG